MYIYIEREREREIERGRERDPLKGPLEGALQIPSRNPFRSRKGPLRGDGSLPKASTQDQDAKAHVDSEGDAEHQLAQMKHLPPW